MIAIFLNVCYWRPMNDSFFVWSSALHQFERKLHASIFFQMASSSVWKICVCHVHDLFTGMRVRDVFIMSENSDRLQRIYTPIVSFIKTERLFYLACAFRPRQKTLYQVCTTNKLSRKEIWYWNNEKKYVARISPFLLSS